MSEVISAALSRGVLHVLPYSACDSEPSHRNFPNGSKSLSKCPTWTAAWVRFMSPHLHIIIISILVRLSFFLFFPESRPILLVSPHFLFLRLSLCFLLAKFIYLLSPEISPPPF